MRRKEFLQQKMWDGSEGLVLCYLNYWHMMVVMVTPSTFSKSEVSFFPWKSIMKAVLGHWLLWGQHYQYALVCVPVIPVAWVSQWWKTWLQQAEAEESKSGRCHVGDSRDPPEQFTITETWSWLRAFVLAVSSAYKAFLSDIPHFLQCFTQLSSSKVEQLTVTITSI